MGHRFASRWGAVVSAVAGALLLLTTPIAQGPVLAGSAAGEQQAPKTVLDGLYTVAQAGRGAVVYNVRCAGCHAGADVDGPPLTGPPFIDRWREDSVRSLYEFIKTQMPQQTPGSLSDPTYLDILAHLLDENEFPAGPHELTIEVVNSALLVGPNGPQPLPSGALVGVVGCLAQTPSREWVVTRAAQAARVRVGTEITAADVTAAAGAALGAQTFMLQNVGEGDTPLPGEGHKVLVKGALSQRAGGASIHVTAARSVASRCG